MENLENDNSMDAAKKLIEAVRKQFEIENEKIYKYRTEIFKEKDFKPRKFYAYNGPNFYLDRQALVFNLFIAPEGDTVEFYKEQIVKYFPKLNEIETPYVVYLFAETLMQVLKMDIDLFIGKYGISSDGDEYVLAVEYLDKEIAEEAVYLVSDWFRAMTNNWEFDFGKEFAKLQAMFDKTLFGGPTLYSLIEAGIKLGIPVIYLYEENQFMWGYGKKQLRGRSTTFHTDGIKDTEFTMYKDMVGDFLEMCGFPTPKGKNCFDEEEIVKEAIKLGFPCVVKPVAGHKGQGVTTNIESETEVRVAFNKIINAAKEEGVNFDGAIVQQQIYGTDHRLISIGGKFVAALERVAAYVDGNGKNTIEELIKEENDKLIRLDNARSPLCKIKIDENLIDFLKLQKLSLTSVPAEGERITLRRVANISAGGVSINVTDKIHPVNVKMVEDIAGYFNVKALGIDVLAADISKPWTEGNFGIIEINAGPGVFMHLAPAYGGSIDVPKHIMLSHFKNGDNGRIPIIATNGVSLNFANMLNDKLHSIKPEIYFGCLLEEGVHFNGAYFYNNPEHNQNVKIILRNPKVDFALFKHNKHDIYDYGLLHTGADIVILDNAAYAEEVVLKEQLLPDALLVEITDNELKLKKNNDVVNTVWADNDADKDYKLLNLIEPYLSEIISRY
ncbi:MAG: Cyanophycin synthetase [Bacteroidetes bacterium ADurb.Bin408]|nr:MAG: Cyanophycin synthetase [Bacteroidetes bacterium ADurb.Bin408]